MKRISLTAALGAALLLAGCSSTSGTATANTSSTVSSTAPSTSSSPDSPAVSAGSSVSAPAGSAASSAPESSGGAVASSGVADSSSRSPATTVGDSNTSLDAQSAAWLSTFCGGFAPVIALGQDASASISAQGTAPAKVQSAIVTLYQALGQAFTETASKLKDLPPPTFDGGPAFATKVVTGLESAGPVFTANATKFKAIDISKDPSAFTGAVSGLAASMTTAMAPLGDLGSLKLTPQTRAAFEALPACAKLKAAAGG